MDDAPGVTGARLPVECSLLREEQTSDGPAAMSPIDPKRTSSRSYPGPTFASKAVVNSKRWAVEKLRTDAAECALIRDLGYG
jgi:hypothetical protein